MKTLCARYLTGPDSAVQGVDSVSWLVAIPTVITRIISCYYWWYLISLMNTEKRTGSYTISKLALQADNRNGLCSSTEGNPSWRVFSYQYLNNTSRSSIQGQASALVLTVTIESPLNHQAMQLAKKC